jgi:hypothetical protein
MVFVLGLGRVGKKRDFLILASKKGFWPLFWQRSFCQNLPSISYAYQAFKYLEVGFSGFDRGGGVIFGIGQYRIVYDTQTPDFAPKPSSILFLLN